MNAIRQEPTINSSKLVISSILDLLKQIISSDVLESTTANRNVAQVSDKEQLRFKVDFRKYNSSVTRVDTNSVRQPTNADGHA